MAKLKKSAMASSMQLLGLASPRKENNNKEMANDVWAPYIHVLKPEKPEDLLNKEAKGQFIC